MKVLVLLPSIGRGGAEAYALEIGKGFKQMGWDLHVGFPHTEGTEGLAEAFTRLGVSYHPVATQGRSFRGPSGKARLAVQVGRLLFLLRKLRPAVVLIIVPYPGFNLGSMMACSLLRMPAMVQFAGTPGVLSVSPGRRRSYARMRSRGQRWFAMSADNRGLLAQTYGMPPDEIGVIYNGVDLKASSGDDRAACRRRLIEELDLPQDAKVLLTVGRFSPLKGYLDLLHAIPLLLRSHPNARFVWLGQGDFRARLEELLESYGIADKVTLMGFQDESPVPWLMTAADLFVFPTHFEGCPLAVLEAMAHSLPIVASDASSLPELIEDKVHGVLFRAQDSCDLLAELEWALDHPGEMGRMGEDARSRVQDFDLQGMVNRTAEALEAVADGEG